MMNKCPKCQEFVYSSGHNCPPEWKCEIIDEYEKFPGGDWQTDEIKTAYAKSAQTAAEKVAEKRFAWGGMECTSWRVIVCPVADVEERDIDEIETAVWFPAGKYQVFDVEVHPEPVFSSQPVKIRT